MDIFYSYFYNIIPREHGITYSPFFPLQTLFHWIVKRRRIEENHYELEEDIKEDEDCKNERQKSHHPDKDYLLRIVDLHKVFYGKTGETKVALQNLCLTVEVCYQ